MIKPYVGGQTLTIAFKRLALMFGLMLLGEVSALAAPPADIALPTVTGPIPGTFYNSNSIAFKPVDLEKLGYGEKEYLISGRSNVYDWSPNGNFATTVLRSGAYTTRIVVRKPKNAERWNGTVVVEIVNMTGFGPTSGFDYPGVWANNWREITREGMAYVGITSKPNIFESLLNFDHERYASLSMANPLPPAQQTCGTLPTDPAYNPNLSKLFENGLIYDAFSQLGALLHSNGPSNPLGKPARRVYLTGLSQSANYLKTYLRFIASRATLHDGGPVFDGYRAEGGGSGAPINQCATKLPVGDPQLGIPDRGVPFIELHSSADFAGDLPRQPDEPWYRRWEVAGAFHDNTWTFEYAFPTDAVFLKTLPELGVVVSRDVIPHCSDIYPPDPPYEDVYDSSLRALEKWVSFGIAAPHVPYIQDVDGQEVLDQFGNPLGGLRLPAVAVPVAAYHTEVFEPTVDCTYKPRLADSELSHLYPTHNRYVEKVAESAFGLVTQRLLTIEDGLNETIVAAGSDVP